MTSFGTQLRAARETEGLSVEYVSFKSKIQPNMIIDLENDDYSGFSSAAYVKSFLRKYSDFLGLDLEDEINSHEIVGYAGADRLAPGHSVKESLEMTEFSTKNQRYRKAEKSKGSPVFLAGSVVVLLSALATFYYMGSRANDPEAGARELVEDFDNTDSPFSRQREAKERLLSEKSPTAPLVTSSSDPSPLASTRRGLPAGASEGQDGVNPLDDFGSLEKPDLKSLPIPENELGSSSPSTPSVPIRDVNPLLDF